ncbi:hypothetical protein EV363DRAFT_1203389 [Boletus edulis]|nr:hypothetical protein EV363DRAFT_1203389 [Boletus edulis]
MNAERDWVRGNDDDGDSAKTETAQLAHYILDMESLVCRDIGPAVPVSATRTGCPPSFA